MHLLYLFIHLHLWTCFLVFIGCCIFSSSENATAAEALSAIKAYPATHHPSGWWHHRGTLLYESPSQSISNIYQHWKAIFPLLPWNNCALSCKVPYHKSGSKIKASYHGDHESHWFPFQQNNELLSSVRHSFTPLSACSIKLKVHASLKSLISALRFDKQEKNARKKMFKAQQIDHGRQRRCT